MQIPRHALILLGLVSLLAASMVACTLVGPAGIALLSLQQDGSGATILYGVRLPRVISAVLVGAALAAAGAVMQGLFRNSMADPYLLGTSSGGALGAATAIILIGGASSWVFAFAGCMGAAFLVYGISRRSGRVPVEQLLLTGIAVSMFLGAVLSFLMYVSGESLHLIFLWLMGGFWNISWQDTWIGFLILPAAVPLLLLSREQDILALGEEDAVSLGVDTELLKKALLGISAFLTAIAVSIAGSIGFIGLITPHIMRLLVGPGHRVLIPASMLAGGTLLVLSDALARTVGNEVPVGVVTAFFGAPFFVFLLRRRYAS